MLSTLVSRLVSTGAEAKYVLHQRQDDGRLSEVTKPQTEVAEVESGRRRRNTDCLKSGAARLP